MKLTGPQRRMLELAARNRLGVVEFEGFGMGVGFMRAAFTKSALKLVKSGLLTPYVHGGFEITPIGRDELAKLPKPKQSAEIIIFPGVRK